MQRVKHSGQVMGQDEGRGFHHRLLLRLLPVRLSLQSCCHGVELHPQPSCFLDSKKLHILSLWRTGRCPGKSEKTVGIFSGEGGKKQSKEAVEAGLLTLLPGGQNRPV